MYSQYESFFVYINFFLCVSLFMIIKVSFSRQKSLILLKSNISIFSFVVSVFLYHFNEKFAYFLVILTK